MTCRQLNPYSNLQVIETLALEDTGIRRDHISQIKDLVKKELTADEDRPTNKKAATSE